MSKSAANRRLPPLRTLWFTLAQILFVVLGLGVMGFLYLVAQQHNVGIVDVVQSDLRYNLMMLLASMAGVGFLILLWVRPMLADPDRQAEAYFYVGAVGITQLMLANVVHAVLLLLFLRGMRTSVGLGPVTAWREITTQGKRLRVISVVGGLILLVGMIYLVALNGPRDMMPLSPGSTG